MRLALVGKTGSITHWLEDAAGAWRADGHVVQLAITRRPWMALSLERALTAQIARRLHARLARFAPDLIVAIGAYHVPLPLLEAISGLPGHPPLAGWVGDVFEPGASAAAGCFDVVGYTDSALLARHHAWGFTAAALYLAHAVDPRAAPPLAAYGSRSTQMVFIANPTPHRRDILRGITSPVALHGPGWGRQDRLTGHEIKGGRIAARRVSSILAQHRAALNIQNEFNVISGLNQRNFQPCLAGATLITDDQPDVARCFTPGAEVLVFRSADEASALYDRVRGDVNFGATVAGRGRDRVLAHHTFAHRLKAITAAVGLTSS